MIGVVKPSKWSIKCGSCTLFTMKPASNWESRGRASLPGVPLGCCCRVGRFIGDDDVPGTVLKMYFARRRVHFNWEVTRVLANVLSYLFVGWKERHYEVDKRVVSSTVPSWKWRCFKMLLHLATTREKQLTPLMASTDRTLDNTVSCLWRLYTVSQRRKEEVIYLSCCIFQMNVSFSFLHP